MEQQCAFTITCTRTLNLMHPHGLRMPALACPPLCPSHPLCHYTHLAPSAPLATASLLSALAASSAARASLSDSN